MQYWIKTVQQINKSLEQLMKKVKISQWFHQTPRSIGSDSARNSWFSMRTQTNTPLRTVLSISSNSYETLNKFLAPSFQNLLGLSNLKTGIKTQYARQNLVSHFLVDKEQIKYLELKKMVYQCGGWRS